MVILNLNMDLSKLLFTLVSIPSPPGKEHKLREFLQRLLERNSAEVEVVEDNLIVNPEADIWVATHLDCATSGYSFRVEGGYAYGSGVCDAKAGIAAILLALKENPTLGCAFFVEEETTGRGSATVAERFPPKKCVVLEPTSLKIASAIGGNLEAVIEFRGKAVHASTPEKGVNAVHTAFEVYSELQKLQNVKTVVLKISGGNEVFALPESCCMHIDLSFTPEVKLEEVKESVIKICNKREAKLEILESEEAFYLRGEMNHALREALLRAGLKPEFCFFPSWCDASNLIKAGWDVSVFGPGELHPCHTPRERVALWEIEKSAEVLAKLK